MTTIYHPTPQHPQQQISLDNLHKQSIQQNNNSNSSNLHNEQKDQNGMKTTTSTINPIPFPSLMQSTNASTTHQCTNKQCSCCSELIVMTENVRILKMKMIVSCGDEVIRECLSC